ncbi:hypothetical protein F4083_07180 [Candidatus Poribacteria bacterium]|nr:hypothetical protein [Candidatus Poribacteria bacterium]MYB66841.1 hypothetical protein [Candidatus Poribacteria bacterium]MYF55916.1 hypothetical protein [Candidatus Poribacteria bacterium]MYI94095.1 hypothetical protein [Candidatus Poribacteria bacterium]
MAIIIEQGEVNNGGIVLSKPLSLPEGTRILIQIEPIETDDDKDSLPDKKEDFANSSFIGMWADREDMQDSVAWVRKQREKWLERITRTE